MLVKDVMTQGVECVGPDESVQVAALKMKDLDVGAIPVCDEDRLVGLLTDRDIVVRCVAEGHDPDSCRVRDFMTPNVLYGFEDQSVADAERMMQVRQIRRLLVLNRRKQLVGIVSLGDLAVRSGDLEHVGELLQDVSGSPVSGW